MTNRFEFPLVLSRILGAMLAVAVCLVSVSAAPADPPKLRQRAVKIDPLREAPEADPPKLRLRAVTFDPLGEAPDLSAVVWEGPALTVPGAPDGTLALVQFLDRPIARWQGELRNLGVELIDYVPDHAYLVRLPDGLSPEAVAAQSFVRAVVDFQPGFKLSPELSFKISNEKAARDDRSRLRIWLLPGVDAKAAAKEVAGRFPRISIEYIFEHPRHPSLTVGLSTKDLRPLAGALLRSTAVYGVVSAPEYRLHNNNSIWIGQSYDRTSGPGEALEPTPKPYSMSATVWNQGLLGQGQIIGIADTELEHTLCQFHDPDVPVIPQYVHAPDPVVLQLDHRKIIALNAPFSTDSIGDGDSYGHGSHTSGSAVGDDFAHMAGLDDPHHDENDGMAPAAKLFFADVGYDSPNCVGQIWALSPYNIFKQMHAAGVRITSNSYGGWANEPTDFDVDNAVWEHPDLLVFFSAGNDGISGGQPVPESVGGGANSKNVIGVGATENYDAAFGGSFGGLDPENMAAFSSEGPTLDGRIKPDLGAPGYQVHSSRYPTDAVWNDDPDYPVLCDPADPDVCVTGWGCVITDTGEGCSTHSLIGTSMSSPTAAGLGALARQYFTDGFYPSGQASAADARLPSAALLKAVLINGSRNMTGHNYEQRGSGADLGPLADAPAYKQGWGRLTLDDGLYFAGDSRKLWITDYPATQGPSTGESHFLQVKASGAGEPFKATLVWTDPPGSVISSQALRNDLDLIVTAPDGTVYKGNQWTADDIDIPGDKHSAPNPAGRDSLNNVEGILIPTPADGTYRFEIRGANVPGYDAMYNQGFALAITGSVEGCGVAAGPADLDATMVRFDDVLLEWDEVPGAVSYNLYRNTGECKSPMAGALVAELPAGQTSFHDGTTLPAMTYNYTVRAVLGDGCETLDSICATVLTPPPPAIASVSPDAGVNNDPTELTITGAAFQATPRVFLGADGDPEHLELWPVTHVSSTELRATVPVNLLSGGYDVKVLNPDSQLDVLADAFQVAAPVQASTLYVSMGDFNPNTVALIDLDQFELIGDFVIYDGNKQSGSIDVASPHKALVAHGWSIGGYRVSLFNPLSLEVGTRVLVGAPPDDLVAHPSGQTAYVVTRTGQEVDGIVQVVDLQQETVVASVPVGPIRYPEIITSADGDQVYSTNTAGEDWDPQPGSVSIIRTSDNVEIARLPVDKTPTALAVTSDATRLYVGNLDSQTITVIDLDALAVLYTLDISDPECLDGQLWCRRMPWVMTISPDDTTLYVGILNQGIAAIDPVSGATLYQNTGASYQGKLIYKEDVGKIYGLRYQGVVRLDPATLAVEDEVQLGYYGRDIAMLDPEPLALSGIDPDLGCSTSGTPVILSGTGFQGEVRDGDGAVVQESTRVFLGAVEATSVTLIDSGTLHVFAPAAEAGVVDVTVQNPNGRSADLASAFTYGPEGCPCPASYSCGGDGCHRDFPPDCQTGDTGQDACLLAGEPFFCTFGETIRVRNCDCASSNPGPLCRNQDQSWYCACDSSQDCDDGLFCNGVETCRGSSCAPGTSPCGLGEYCDEEADRCVAACPPSYGCGSGGCQQAFPPACQTTQTTLDECWSGSEILECGPGESIHIRNCDCKKGNPGPLCRRNNQSWFCNR